MLETEIAYFDRVQGELAARFSGMFVVVKGEEVVGRFNTIQEALAEGARRFGLESFLVRQLGAAPREVSAPALTLGLLRAGPTRPDNG